MTHKLPSPPFRFARLSMAACLLFPNISQALAAGNEALQFFEEEAKVITASRRLEPIREAPVAVDVVTAEEIRYSGAVNLWDLLRFRVGMNVVDGRSGEGNRALVSVRGFPAEFVDNMLVLVDGRSVYTGLSGGAVWDSLPVQIQDIERIEIVRGPNAALYGSNAGLGVINIITKTPKKKRALSGEVLAGNRDLQRQQAAWEDAFSAGTYRLSFAHKHLLGNPMTAGGNGSDDLRSYKGNARAAWSPSERSTLELLSGGTWDDIGVIDNANPRGRFRHHFQMLKYGWERDEDSAVHSMLSRRDDTRTYVKPNGSLLTVREYQYDIEAQHRVDWQDGRLRTVYGGGFRYNGIDSSQLFAHPFQKNALSRGFATQSVRVHPALNLIGAFSMEHSDTGGTEPAYQFAAVAKPATDHTLRASYGRASTIPTMYEKRARQISGGVLLLGNSQMLPQRLHSYEAGWLGRFLNRRLDTEVNLFYMDLERLSTTVVQSFFPVFTLSFNNGNCALARGVEAKAGLRLAPGRSLYANYTYETISDARGEVNVRKGTPKHKLNVGGYTILGRGFSLGLNAGYQDGHTLSAQSTGQTRDIPAYWRLDGRLAYSPRDGIELFVACQNMARERHLEFADGLEIPRTYRGGVRVKFGPRAP